MAGSPQTSQYGFGAHRGIEDAHSRGSVWGGTAALLPSAVVVVAIPLISAIIAGPQLSVEQPPSSIWSTAAQFPVVAPTAPLLKTILASGQDPSQSPAWFSYLSPILAPAQPLPQEPQYGAGANRGLEDLHSRGLLWGGTARFTVVQPQLSAPFIFARQESPELSPSWIVHAPPPSALPAPLQLALFARQESLEQPQPLVARFTAPPQQLSLPPLIFARQESSEQQPSWITYAPPLSVSAPPSRPILSARQESPEQFPASIYQAPPPSAISPLVRSVLFARQESTEQFQASLFHVPPPSTDLSPVIFYSFLVRGAQKRPGWRKHKWVEDLVDEAFAEEFAPAVEVGPVLATADVEPPPSLPPIDFSPLARELYALSTEIYALRIQQEVEDEDEDDALFMVS